MSFQGIDGCRTFISAGRRRDVSEMISRQRTTPDRVRMSSRKPRKSSPSTELRASLIWCSISRRGTEGSEGIDRINRGLLLNIRLQPIAVDHIHWPLKQIGDVAFQARIIENHH